MFCAYNWFEKPELYATVRAASLEWAALGERLLFGDTGRNQTFLLPEKRFLTATELTNLKERLDNAWQKQGFGGFISGAALSDLKGWCHFKLNRERTEARLAGLLLDPALSDLPPLQNPALHLALLALLRDEPDLEAVFLPFGEITDLDRAAMKMFTLAPRDEAGWWLTRQRFQRKTDFLSFGQDMISPTWYELKLKVERGLFRLVLRLFTRFGFPDKTWFVASVKYGLLGEELEDETGPVTVITYLPKNDRNSQNLADLQETLHNLAIITPLPELELREISRAGATPYEVNSEFKYGTYRVGRNLIIQTRKEDQANNDAQLGPNDLLIKINSASGVFGPQPRYIHPTGQLTLELMEDWLDPAQHAKVLDLGTGSGALAIAAARLGINYILAIDPNREAVRLAQENVALNSLEDQIVVEGGSLGLKDSNESGYAFREELQQRPPSLDKDLPFDAILANIFSSNLVTLSGALSDALRPGGLLISSGIPAKDVALVAAAFEVVGLELVEKRELFGWFAFVHKKV